MTTYINPVESAEHGNVEFRVGAGSGDTAGTCEVGVFDFGEGDEIVQTFLGRERATELRDALSAWLDG